MVICKCWVVASASDSDGRLHPGRCSIPGHTNSATLSIRSLVTGALSEIHRLFVDVFMLCTRCAQLCVRRTFAVLFVLVTGALSKIRLLGALDASVYFRDCIRCIRCQCLYWMH